MNRVPVLGLKAPDVTAWAGASPASAGPCHASLKISQGLKGRNHLSITPPVPPLQGGGVSGVDFVSVHRT